VVRVLKKMNVVLFNYLTKNISDALSTFESNAMLNLACYPAKHTIKIRYFYIMKTITPIKVLPFLLLTS